MSLSTVDNAAVEFVVLDDDNMILEIVDRFLGRTSTTYRLFTDPEVAIAYLQQTHSLPRILLVDFYMPTMTGVDFLNHLSANVSLSESAVFLCSGVEPQAKQTEQLHYRDVNLLDKSVITDRESLIQLIECEKYQRRDKAT